MIFIDGYEGEVSPQRRYGALPHTRRPPLRGAPRNAPFAPIVHGGACAE